MTQAAPAQAVVPSAQPAPITVVPAGQQSTAQAAQGAAPSGATSDWTSGLNEDLKGFVHNKGFKAPTDALESYRNLEKLMGAPRERLLKLPENMDDAPSMAEIYTRLGRPETPEGYKIETPKENGNPEFVKWAGGTFHELGLSAKQGQALVNKWNDFAANALKQEADQNQAKIATQHDALKKKWGAAFDQNVKIAKMASREFNIPAEVVDKMESAMGFDAVMEFLHTVGTKVGEPSFHTGGAGSFGVLTPEAARNKINALRQDTEFTKRYLAGDSGARSEMDRLHHQAFPSS